jgi:hypothetical protein
MGKYKEFDFSGLKKYKLADRASKVDISQFADIKDTSIQSFLETIPDILKGRDFLELLECTFQAFLQKKSILIGLGGHVIKTGMSPLFIELTRLGAITGFCVNGSVAIHDYEIGVYGATSEDVQEALSDGSFGMATDTSDTINSIVSQGSKQNLGYGEAIGKYLAENQITYPQLSLLRYSYQHDVPVTVHIALGTDITHQHETADGSAIGDCSMRDFRIFTQLVSQLGNGGVFICFGSAVILPEVFLKAVAVSRNKGFELKNITTAVFDMNQQYRPQVNIASRPVYNAGKGYYFVGHHEIMIPLFLHALREKIIQAGAVQ